MTHSASTTAAPAAPTGVSVIVPAFNEMDGIERCLRETAAAMQTFDEPYEIIVVDDGSSDATVERAVHLAHTMPEVRVVAADHNVGKGAALIHGGLLARYGLVLFVDADLEIHPRQFAVLRARMEAEHADVVIASKLHPDSVVDYPTERRIISLGYYAIVRLLFRLPVRDTQTGLKLYRREVLEDVLPRLLSKRFAMDLELLVTAHRRGAKIVEAPVVVTRERAFPRIGGADVRNVAQDTAAIWYRTYLLHYYDRPIARFRELTPTEVPAPSGAVPPSRSAP